MGKKKKQKLGAEQSQAELETSKTLTIFKPLKKTLRLAIVGDTPLLVNRKSEMAMDKLRAGQQGKVFEKKAKDPEECYQQSLYKMDDSATGFPASGIKKAMYSACGLVNGKPWSKLTASVFISAKDNLVKINGASKNFEAMTKVGRGNADLRYRGKYDEWSINLVITFDERNISVEEIVNLLDVAGFSIGIGDWRPQKKGDLGRFHVDPKSIYLASK